MRGRKPLRFEFQIIHVTKRSSSCFSQSYFYHPRSEISAGTVYIYPSSTATKNVNLQFGIEFGAMTNVKRTLLRTVYNHVLRVFVFWVLLKVSQFSLLSFCRLMWLSLFSQGRPYACKITLSSVVIPFRRSVSSSLHFWNFNFDLIGNYLTEVVFCGQ